MMDHITDQGDELTTSAIAAPAPNLVVLSCDDNLIFETETVARSWTVTPAVWHSNDNNPWPSDIAG